MNQRQKELEEIVQVSSQIKDMTQVMKKDVETQGEQLNNVESTTDVVKEEVTKEYFIKYIVSIFAFLSHR